MRTCDVCGAPATNASRDLREVVGKKEYKEFEVYGKTFYGCDKHPTSSRTYYVTDMDYPRKLEFGVKVRHNKIVALVTEVYEDTCLITYLDGNTETVDINSLEILIA